jgi:hypothetical protein
MDRIAEHHQNLTNEKHWILDAARDRANLDEEGHRLWARGKRVEARFDFEEAKNAESWVNKRKRILDRERSYVR